MTRQVACPACGKPVAWTQQNQWRPFCSERCKTIDLGDWAANRHVVVGSGEDVEPSSTPLQESTRGARAPSKHSES